MYMSKGMSAMRLMTALTSFFVLTIIFTYFDPVVEDDIYGFADERLTGTPQAVIDKYLGAWHFWVPAFLLAIFIYVVSAGMERQESRV
jgi:hypothetical protein